MSLTTLRDALPAYATDVAAGADQLREGRDLSPLELEGCLVACAVAAAEPRTLRALAQHARLRPAELEAAKAAAAVSTLNNIYYGAIGALQNTEYGSMPSGLSETTLADPGVERAVFELWCFSVSALHTCAPSMDAHEKELRSRGVEPARLQTAIRAAAVIGAAARVLAAEAALADRGAGSPGRQEDEARGEGGDASGGGVEATPPPDVVRPAGSADPAVVGAPHPAPAPGEVAPG